MIKDVQFLETFILTMMSFCKTETWFIITDKINSGICYKCLLWCLLWDTTVNPFIIKWMKQLLFKHYKLSCHHIVSHLKHSWWRGGKSSLNWTSILTIVFIFNIVHFVSSIYFRKVCLSSLRIRQPECWLILFVWFKGNVDILNALDTGKEYIDAK